MLRNIGIPHTRKKGLLFTSGNLARFPSQDTPRTSFHSRMQIWDSITRSFKSWFRDVKKSILYPLGSIQAPARATTWGTLSLAHCRLVSGPPQFIWYLYGEFVHQIKTFSGGGSFPWFHDFYEWSFSLFPWPQRLIQSITVRRNKMLITPRD